MTVKLMSRVYIVLILRYNAKFDTKTNSMEGLINTGFYTFMYKKKYELNKKTTTLH